MKTLFLTVLSSVFFSGAFAQGRLPAQELEVRAREAVKLAYQKAIVDGNGWFQQVLGGVDNTPASVEFDEISPEVVHVVLYNEAQECAVYVKMDSMGYTTAPVSFDCAEH